MTQLAKELGIELKPFCVRTEDFTEQEIADLLDRSVDIGAQADEAYVDAVTRHKFPDKIYDYGYFTYTGVHCDLVTWVEDSLWYYSNNLLSREEALTYLHLEAKDGRLVVIEEVLPTLKLSLEELLEPLQNVTEDDYVFNLADKLAKAATESVYLSTHGILKLFDVYVKAYLVEVYEQSNPNALLQKIEAKKGELTELENKLNELKNKQGY